MVRANTVFEKRHRNVPQSKFHQGFNFPKYPDSAVSLRKIFLEACSTERINFLRFSINFHLAKTSKFA